MTGTMTVRPAGPEDARAVMAALGRACLDETVFSWVIPDETARRALVEGWARHALDWLSGALGTGEILVVERGTGEILGLSVWEHRAGEPAGATPPGRGTARGGAGTDPVAGDEGDDAVARAYGEYAPRMALVGRLTRQRHPDREPHWYLQQMVVVPALRGQGLGAAMLRHQLARVDAAGLGAYLEASSPRNRPLYERHGFRPRGGPIRLPDGGPVLQPMWRPPARQG